jgi:hypothetical protein
MRSFSDHTISILVLKTNYNACNMVVGKCVLARSDTIDPDVVDRQRGVRQMAQAESDILRSSSEFVVLI